MAKGYFEFKQFTIHQDCCAMKVGTDGTLLGAWASAPTGACRILDIGTGTGLIALMMAQRYPKAEVIGIDMDGGAVSQATTNAADSPFSNRIRIVLADIADFSVEPFDSIVCNPPFFVDSLTCPDSSRTMARHTGSLTYKTLIQSVKRLLKDDGLFSVVVPVDYRSQLLSEAALAGLILSRECAIKTTPEKAPKRCLMEFRKQPVTLVISTTETLEIRPGQRSDWYHRLTKDFYLK
ncbi:MAG: methyltransferase domain-containing protein [Prevotella sp.]|nr:methyltransferase domain-containing protein [Prevotella sp.]